MLTLARAQTRAEPIVLEPVAVERLLEEIAEELGGRDDVEVVVDAPPGLVVSAHPDLLAQAVGNLAENAVAHSGARLVTLAAVAHGPDRVRIEVRDDGLGIAAEHRERVFDRFYRGGDRANGGFGLGLAIVREVAGVLGGEVELEPADGGGTTAAIVLPAAPVAAGTGRAS
jgi:signal transduction histidine kinase